MNWPCEEKNWLSKGCTKLKQTWKSNIGKRENTDIALHEINQEFESQRLQLQQANQGADQARRHKISLYGELEMKNESSEKIKQHITKKMKN